MVNTRKVKQCGYCGQIWELDDVIEGFQCNCGTDGEKFEDSIFCEECNTVYDTGLKHTQKNCDSNKHNNWRDKK